MFQLFSMHKVVYNNFSIRITTIAVNKRKVSNCSTICFLFEWNVYIWSNIYKKTLKKWLNNWLHQCSVNKLVSFRLFLHSFGIFKSSHEENALWQVIVDIEEEGPIANESTGLQWTRHPQTDQSCGCRCFRSFFIDFNERFVGGCVHRQTLAESRQISRWRVEKISKSHVD